MTRPVVDEQGRAMGSVRSHYERLVSRGRTEYAAKLEAPPMPAGFGYLWTAHQDVSAGRGTGGMGPARLTWGDLTAWQAVSGVQLTAWEAEVVLAMDAALVEAATRED